MTASTHPADMSTGGARIDMTSAAMQQALEAIEGSGHKADLIAAADALRAALAEQAHYAPMPPTNDGCRPVQDSKPEPFITTGLAQYAALAEQAQPEPIGEVVIGEEGMVKGWTVVRWRADLPPIAPGTKLYTTPPAPVVPPGWRMVPVEATPEMEQAQPVAWPMDVTLDQPACELLHAMLSPALPDDDEVSAVRLLIGQGHSGYGLYVASSEYPEEGAEMLAGLSAPTPPAPVAPPGWRMVPVEATQEMTEAGATSINDNGGNARWADIREAWADMLAAAPEAPTPPAPVVPPGWRMVPVEPTQEMVAAAQKCSAEEYGRDDPMTSLGRAETWSCIEAAIAAAPETPTPPAPQPLTDADIEALHKAATGYGLSPLGDERKFARAVEAEVMKRMGVQR